MDRLLVFQTLTMPGDEVVRPPADLDSDHRDPMLKAGWPKMAFIEHSLAGDPTNWWAPNHACVEALLRSSGLRVASCPGTRSTCVKPITPRRNPAAASIATSSTPPPAGPAPVRIRTLMTRRRRRVRPCSDRCVSVDVHASAPFPSAAPPPGRLRRALQFAAPHRRAVVAIMLLTLALSAVGAAAATPEQTRRERVLPNQWARIYSRFNEVLSGIVTVRSFAMEEMEKRRFLADVAAANQTIIRGIRTDSSFGAAGNLLVALARIAAIFVGGVIVIHGEMTVGTLVAFLGYVGGLFGPVQRLTGIYQTIQRASVSLDEIFAILDVQEHLGDTPYAEEVTEVRGHVEFDHVSFSYEQAGRPLLQNVAFTVAPGRRSPSSDPVAPARRRSWRSSCASTIRSMAPSASMAAICAG